MQKILGQFNAKTIKGEKQGYRTAIVYLAPSNASGEANLCPNASKGCRDACLFTAGRGRMSPVMNARIKKSLFFIRERENFMRQLVTEIAAFIKSCARVELIPCVRLNGTSDVAWENIKIDGKSIMQIFPNLQFYDYTKSLARMVSFCNGKLPANYHLTFSRSENTKEKTIKDIILMGGNVAVVYKDALPVYDFSAEVLNGDTSDLRFKDGRGKVVGLIAKGDAKKDESGFVIDKNLVTM